MIIRTWIEMMARCFCVVIAVYFFTTLNPDWIGISIIGIFGILWVALPMYDYPKFRIKKDKEVKTNGRNISKD